MNPELLTAVLVWAAAAALQFWEGAPPVEEYLIVDVAVVGFIFFTAGFQKLFNSSSGGGGRGAL